MNENSKSLYNIYFQDIIMNLGVFCLVHSINRFILLRLICVYPHFFKHFINFFFGLLLLVMSPSFFLGIFAIYSTVRSLHGGKTKYESKQTIARKKHFISNHTKKNILFQLLLEIRVPLIPNKSSGGRDHSHVFERNSLELE